MAPASRRNKARAYHVRDDGDTADSIWLALAVRNSAESRPVRRNRPARLGYRGHVRDNRGLLDQAASRLVRDGADRRAGRHVARSRHFQRRRLQNPEQHPGTM